MKILIDGEIFQRHMRTDQGAWSDWKGFLLKLTQQLPESKIVILLCSGAEIDLEGLDVACVTVEEAPNSADADEWDEKLRQICCQVDADVFIGTCSRRAPGVLNVVLLHDSMASMGAWNSAPSTHAQNLRAVETADAMISSSKALLDEWASQLPHIRHLPYLIWGPNQQADPSFGAFIYTLYENRSILLTAIVSTYNSARFIRGCLQDLSDQTIAHALEIIIVDSASQEDEAAVVREFQKNRPGIKYIRTAKRENIYQAWNRGIKFAFGKYVTNANTDDRHRRDAFEKMIAVLEANEDIALVYADVIVTQTANETFNACTPTGMLHWFDWDRNKLLTEGCFIGPQPVWRKRVHETYGYFDESYDVSADFEFWLRISQTNAFYHLDIPMGLYLERPDSIEHAHSAKKYKEDLKITTIYQKAKVNNQLIKRIIEKPSPAIEAKRLRSETRQEKLAKQIYPGADVRAATNQGGKIMNSPDIVLNAIHVLIDGGHREAALWALSKLVLDYPDHAHLHDNTAALAYELGEMATAEQHWKEAVRLAPDSTVFRKHLGDYYYVVAKDARQALEQYEGALESDPRNSDVLLMAGHVTLSLHHYEEARDYYRRVLSRDPGNLEIQQMVDKIDAKLSTPSINAMTSEEVRAVAEEKIKTGDQAGAIKLLQKLLQRDGEQAPVHNDLGVLHYECGDKAKALEHYEKATTLLPENETFQKNLADFYWVELGDHQRAMQAYVQVLKLKPQDVEALLHCAQICITLGKTDDARDFLNTALEIESWNDDARQLLAQMEELPGQTNPAAQENHPGLNTPGTADPVETSDAVDELRRQLTAHPDDAALHNHLGVLLYEAGDKAQALTAYEQAVRLEPQDPTYQKNLADFYMFEENRVEEAMKLYLSVLTEYPEDVEALNATGTISSALGKLDDARYFYQRVLEIEPWNENAMQALKALPEQNAELDTQIDKQCAAG